MRFVNTSDYRAMLTVIGVKIKQARKLRGINRVALAKLTGMRVDGIYEIESGRRKNLLLSTALAIIDALELDATSFFNECMDEAKKRREKEHEKD